MSSSELDSKIDLLDSAEVVGSKLRGAVCPAGMSAEQGNGVLAFVKFVVFALLNTEESSENFVVSRSMFSLPSRFLYYATSMDLFRMREASTSTPCKISPLTMIDNSS